MKKAIQWLVLLSVLAGGGYWLRQNYPEQFSSGKTGVRSTPKRQATLSTAVVGTREITLEYASRNADGNAVVRHRLQNQRTGTDDAMLSDAGRDNRSLAQPCIFADGHRFMMAALFPDGDVKSFCSML